MFMRFFFPFVLRFAILKWAEQIKSKYVAEQNQSTNQKNKKGTEDLGEYIDYEEIE